MNSDPVIGAAKLGMSEQPAGDPGRSPAPASGALLPYLAALVFPLGQLAANASLLPSWSKVLVVVAAVLSVAAVVDIGTRLVWRHSPARPLVAVVLILGFFAYGHVRLMYAMSHGYFLIVWAIEIALVLLLVRRFSQRSTLYPKFVNGMRLFLTVTLLIQSGLLAWKLWPHGSNVTQLSSGSGATPVESLPSIYYIILDGYGRKDVLDDTYGFDNSDFLDQMRERGFYVATKSHSNYGQTALSLASSLNMDFVHNLVESKDNASRNALRDLIVSSRVDAMLKDAGYRTVSIDSGYSYTRRVQSDEFLASSYYGRDEVDRAIIGTTVLPPILDWFQVNEFESHRRQLLSAFKLVADAGHSPHPKFVFAHFVAPHPPFVFDANGKSVDPVQPFGLADGDAYVGKEITQAQYRKQYVDQLRFVNKKTLEMIDGILADTSGNAVIIIQGDHGPGSGLAHNSVNDTDLRERFSILNAIRLPPGKEMDCYEEQSPVNTFRLLLNELLGTNFKKLPDQSFFARWDAPLQTIEITDQLD